MSAADIESEDGLHRDIVDIRREAPPQDLIQREGGLAEDQRRPALEDRPEDELQQLVGAVPDQDPLGHPAGERRQLTDLRGRVEGRIARPRLPGKAIQDLLFDRLRQLEGILVLVELDPR